jgi:hypothetical protein
MAAKTKASKIKARNTTSKQTKNKVWSDDEVITYANVLCSTDNAERSWLYQIENYALKKSANEELFRRIKEDFDILRWVTILVMKHLPLNNYVQSSSG